MDGTSWSGQCQPCTGKLGAAWLMVRCVSSKLSPWKRAWCGMGVGNISGNACWAFLNLRGSERRREAAQALMASGGGRWSGLIARMLWKAAALVLEITWVFHSKNNFLFLFVPPPTKFCLLRSICLNDGLQGREHRSLCAQTLFLPLGGYGSDDVCVFHEVHKTLHVAFFFLQLVPGRGTILVKSMNPA